MDDPGAGSPRPGPPARDGFLWNFAKDLVAGTVGGTAGIVAGQPADTVKVRVQTGWSPPSLPAAAAAASSSSSSSASFSGGSLRLAVHMLRHEGATSFFRGMLAPLVANAPINAIIFSVYGGLIRHAERERRHEPQRAATLVEQLAAGACGGAAQCVVACPSELIKVQQQVSTTTTAAAAAGAHATQPRHVPQSTWQLARARVRQAGWARGAFQGWNATLLRDVPAFGLYFFTYGLFKARLETLVARGRPLAAAGDGYHQSDSTWLETTFPAFMAGGMAGVASWVLTMPCDVVKSRVQSLPLDTPAAERRWLAVAAGGLRQDGPGYFFRGAGPAVLRAFPVSAVVFSVYEFVMRFLDRFDADADDGGLPPLPPLPPRPRPPLPPMVEYP